MPLPGAALLSVSSAATRPSLIPAKAHPAGVAQGEYAPMVAPRYQYTQVDAHTTDISGFAGASAYADALGAADAGVGNFVKVAAALGILVGIGMYAEKAEKRKARRNRGRKRRR